MAEQYTKRQRNGLLAGRDRTGAQLGRKPSESREGSIARCGGWPAIKSGGLIERGSGGEQGRWAYHPPPWRRWLGVAACVAGMAWGTEARAQMASAPFVFEGDVLRIETPGWESDRDYLIDASAYIEVADGIEAHLRGNIGAVFGSPNGLYKLGAGTLRLSGC
ncbi:hypothetical protein CSC67_05910 [Pusillimonas caeni]|uniref:hypothetical protein n=1 Tax=Pusillimonas caeni TaxID=1348472 RepID=UPI0010754598|nr:hypothetical protein [Pusillimonas caeni]TFL14876.1 hypothetical protein CSC67_05910 [Pusillimonas caeni]